MDVMTSNIYRKRVDFSKIKTYLPIPNLIDIQRKSYDDFLQMRELPKDRKDTGLQAAFKSVFNIEDYRGLAKLEFVEYAVGDWECKCGHLKGIEHNRIQCTQCGASVYVEDTTDSYATSGSADTGTRTPWTAAPSVRHRRALRLHIQWKNVKNAE